MLKFWQANLCEYLSNCHLYPSIFEIRLVHLIVIFVFGEDLNNFRYRLRTKRNKFLRICLIFQRMVWYSTADLFNAKCKNSAHPHFRAILFLTISWLFSVYSFATRACLMFLIHSLYLYLFLCLYLCLCLCLCLFICLEFLGLQSLTSFSSYSYFIFWSTPFSLASTFISLFFLFINLHPHCQSSFDFFSIICPSTFSYSNFRWGHSKIF